MNELQSHDYVIPAFLLMEPRSTDGNGSDTPMDDFLKYLRGWSEFMPPEEFE